MLRWWKRKVMVSLLNWLDRKNKDTHKFLHDRNHKLRKVGLTAEEAQSKRLVQFRAGSYRWTLLGLTSYNAWWTFRYARWAADLEPGRDAVARAGRLLWWQWDDGSRPFHWRWTEFYIQTITDGLPVHFKSEKPRFMQPQPGTKDETTKDQVKAKIRKITDRRYLTTGQITSLTTFFPVSKGESNVRMVYDGSASGLNDAIWVPIFPLPTIQTHLRAVEEGTYMANLDIGEMFLNFVLHKELRKLCGVDIWLYADNKNF
jgi:hypothetical protein